MKKFFLYIFLFFCSVAFSRAGSGVSHGGSGSHFGGGGYHGYGNYGGYAYHYNESRPLTHKEVMVLVICMISVVLALTAYAGYITYLYYNKGKINKKKLQLRFEKDSFWDYDKIVLHATTLYIELQKTWSIGDLTSVKQKLSPRLYRNYSGILSRYKKRGLYNIVEDIEIKETSIIYFDDYDDNSKDTVALLIAGELKDYFSNSGPGKTSSKKPFKDAYVFTRKNNQLILDEILNEPDHYQITKPINYIETK